MTTRIFVMTHKKFDPPANTIYVPLQVGKAGKEGLGYLGDDTGENISHLNCYYGELTGLYWLWKNRKFDGNIGVCHYRRFFVNDKRELLSEKDYDQILSDYDIMTSQEIKTDVPYLEYFGKAHHVEDMLQAGEVIQQIYPDDYASFEIVMQEKAYYFGNLMVTSGKIFDEYCEWLFTIFGELSKRLDVESYDDYHRRVYGFLSEQLLRVYIHARGLKVYEGQIAITDEKAETKELKAAMYQLVKMGEISQARQMFYEIIKIRPDVRLEHSDVLGELPLIEQILYIIESEMQREMTGMYDYSKDLYILLDHVKKLLRILAKTDAWNDEDQAYFQETNVTPIAVEILAKNHMNCSDRWEQIVATYHRVASEQKEDKKTYVWIDIDGASFEDTFIKNQNIAHTTETYLIFANQNVVTAQEVEEILERYRYMDHTPLLVLGQYVPKTNDLYGILEDLQLETYAMVVKRELFSKTGPFNDRLQEGSNREFLCRASCVCEPVFLECSDVNWQCQHTEGEWFTNAYLLVRYLKQLTEAGLMETMLNVYIAHANTQGFQSYFEHILQQFLAQDQELYQKIYLATAPFFIIRGGDICYSVLRTFADRFANALKQCGQRVIMTSGDDTEVTNLEALQKEHFRGIIGFQATILLKPVFHNVKGKRFDYWFDHPIFFHTLFNQMDTPVTFLCQDGNHADYINRMCEKGMGFHFPPAVSPVTEPLQEKRYDISFMGTYFDENKLWTIVNGMEAELGDLAREVATYLLQHPDMSYNEVTDMFLEQYPQITEKYSYEVIMEHLWEACRIAPYTYRNRVVRTILDAGYELHVYGEPWKGFPLREGDRLVCHEEVPSKEVARVIAQSKISLNVMSWHKDGMTERIMEIMMGKSVCLTDETRYLKKHFNQMEDIVMFQLHALDQLPDMIGKLLKDDALRKKITEHAYQKVMSEHTWDVRAEQFLDMVKEMEEA